MRFPNSWFSADPPRDVAAFDDQYYYRPAGAYVETKEQPVYRFVINRVNLETGNDQDLTLSVPFIGDFSLPITNYSVVNDTMHSTEPHLLWIRGMSIEDAVLRILVKRPGSDPDVALDFQLPQ